MTDPDRPAAEATDGAAVPFAEATDGAALPFADGLRRLVDSAASLIARRPVRVRVRPSAAGVASGRLDRVEVELSGVATAGLVVDRLRVVAEDLRVLPGLPPRLRAEEVRTIATVEERSLQRWLRSERGPVDVRLRADGIVIRTRVGGFRIHQVQAALVVQGRWLRLEPRSASVLGLPAPMSPLFSGYLPLPPLPTGTRLVGVEHAEGELSATFSLGPAEEPLDLGLAGRIRDRFLIGPPR